MTHDCKEMLKSKLEEIELYNSAIPQTQSQNILQNRNRRQKCYKCRQRGHIIKNCPIKEKKHVDGTEKSSGTSETAETVSKQLMTAKPTVSLKYPEWIHFSTKCMIEGTDKGHWDEIWYISNDTNIHLCSKLNLFGNIKEKFAVRKLEDQMKFLFTYGLGEVVIINGDEKYLIPGVYYAPEVTLNILSVEQLERQGVEIKYENNTCRLTYMFSNPKDNKIDEDKLRMMQNEYLEKYFESVEEGNHSDAENKTIGLISMENDLIEIKGAIYSTKRLWKKTNSILVLHLVNVILLRSKPLAWKQQIEKEKQKRIEHFDVKLEDINEVEDPDSQQFHPTQLNNEGGPTLNKDIETMINTSTISEPADKEDNGSTSSDDLVIIV
ncbi:ARID DNA-binding domain-containing protein [Tanacetum coccineum]